VQYRYVADFTAGFANITLKVDRSAAVNAVFHTTQVLTGAASNYMPITNATLTWQGP
jgi:hypothetical protein